MTTQLQACATGPDKHLGPGSFYAVRGRDDPFDLAVPAEPGDVIEVTLSAASTDNYPGSITFDANVGPRGHRLTTTLRGVPTWSIPSCSADPITGTHSFVVDNRHLDHDGIVSLRLLVQVEDSAGRTLRIADGSVSWSARVLSSDEAAAARSAVEPRKLSETPARGALLVHEDNCPGVRLEPVGPPEAGTTRCLDCHASNRPNYSGRPTNYIDGKRWTAR